MQIDKFILFIFTFYFITYDLIWEIYSKFKPKG